MIEIKDPRMFQKSIDDTRHANAVTEAGDLRHQTINASNIQMDIDSGLRSTVESLNDLRVGK